MRASVGSNIMQSVTLEKKKKLTITSFKIYGKYKEDNFKVF